MLGGKMVGAYERGMWHACRGPFIVESLPKPVVVARWVQNDWGTGGWEVGCEVLGREFMGD